MSTVNGMHTVPVIGINFEAMLNAVHGVGASPMRINSPLSTHGLVVNLSHKKKSAAPELTSSLSPANVLDTWNCKFCKPWRLPVYCPMVWEPEPNREMATVTGLSRSRSSWKFLKGADFPATADHTRGDATYVPSKVMGLPLALATMKASVTGKAMSISSFSRSSSIFPVPSGTSWKLTSSPCLAKMPFSRQSKSGRFTCSGTKPRRNEDDDMLDAVCCAIPEV